MRFYVRYDSVSSCRQSIRYLSAVTVSGPKFGICQWKCHALHIDRMLMLISKKDAKIGENNIFNKILRCAVYFNTKGTATIKPLFALGEPLYLYTPLVRSISYRYQSWYTTVLSEKWPESKPERDT